MCVGNWGPLGWVMSVWSRRPRPWCGQAAVVRFGFCIELDLTLGAGKWLQGRYMPMLPVRVPSLASLVVLQVHLDASKSCLLASLPFRGKTHKGKRKYIVAQQTHRSSRSVEQR